MKHTSFLIFQAIVLAGIGTVLLESLLPRIHWASPSTSLDKKTNGI
jgi:hypothetical protein